MEDDYSDILGSGALNVKPQSGLSFRVKVLFLSISLLVLYIVGLNAWNKFLKWRERSYRLSTRRKYGIPDNDHRPFNVAYAAVLRARQERETLRSVKFKPMNNLPREQPRPSAQSRQDIRHRMGVGRNVGVTWASDRTRGLPGGYDQNALQTTTAGTRHGHNNGQSGSYLNEGKVLYPRTTELVSNTSYLTSGQARGPKRLRNSDSDTWKRNYMREDVDDAPDMAKKPRMKGVHPVDGETKGRYHQLYAAPKRGSKRELGDTNEMDDILESKRAREKRARKVSLEKELVDDDMEIDEDDIEDGVADLSQVSRGKKRDRAEAGSTFGGDEEDDSESEIPEEPKAQRSRKRRSVTQRKNDIGTSLRGKKRDRDIDDEPSDDGSDNGSGQASARKRRNKKGGLSPEQEADEDISMDESPSKSKSRRIGEEWTSNSVSFKIGPNGQKLRQALVKKARQKYSMPEDSQHPDRDANLEIYIETWLTEEEYQDAKARHLLAWQDSPKGSMQRQTKVNDEQSPSPTGKSLLWKSTATPPISPPDATESPATPIPRSKRIAHDPRRQTIAVDLGSRINPFQQYSSQPTKRIASGTSRVSSLYGTASGSPGLVDSTNGSPRAIHRAYSKWEKQDLEANAMMKMREAARKKEAEEKEHQEKEQAEREKAEKAKVAAFIPPIITITKPAEKTPEVESRVSNVFGKPAEPPKNTTQSSIPLSMPPSMFAPGPTKPSDKPTENKPSLFPAPTAPTPQPTFSFAKPLASPLATGTAAKPSDASTKVTEQPKPSLFAPSQSTVAPANVPASASATTSTPLFSFTAKPPSGVEQKKEDQRGQAGGTSLLSRLGGPAAPSMMTAPSSQPPPFSFPKPPEQPKSVFGTTTVSSQVPSSQPSIVGTTSTPAPLIGGATSSGLKFNFGFQNTKSSNLMPTQGNAPPAEGTTATGNLSFPSADSSKPATAPIFSFKAPAASGTPSATPATGGGTGAPKSAFGITGGPLGGVTTGAQAPKDAGSTKLGFSTYASTPGGASPFAFGSGGSLENASARSGFSGFGGNNASASNTANLGNASKTTGFSGFGNTQASSTTTSSTSTTPAFGTGLGATAFGGSSPSVGVFGTKLGDAPKPSFMSGQPSVPAAGASATGTVGASKSLFTFKPVPNAAAASIATNSGPSFSFGKPGAVPDGAKSAFPSPSNPNISTTASSTGPTFGFDPKPSVSGAPASGQSVFGGTSVTNSTSTPLAFGGPAGGPSLFGNNTKVPTVFGAGGQSAFGNVPSAATNPTSSTSPIFTFGATPSNKSGQN
ncbi:hypothetical protein AX17_002098 [Amanita inopinata Kibby_2008]|nr:hypothetical protein AX17_002098 [Amanita inopinata Kibby_2008]